MRRTSRRFVACAVGLLMLASVVATGSAAYAAKQDEAGSTDIVLKGEAVNGHDYTAYRLADYKNKLYSDSNMNADTMVRGYDPQTVTGVSTAEVTLPDGTTVLNVGTAFNVALARAVVQIAEMSVPDSPTPVLGAEDTLVSGLDPLVYVAQVWQMSATATKDPWGNEEANSAKVRKLANWINGIAVRFNLDSATVTGSNGVATLATGEGLWFVKDSTADNSSPEISTLTSGIIVGTEFEYGSTYYSDLYDSTGAKKQDLGVVNVKGDGITVDKTFDKATDKTSQIDNVIPFTITATIPNYGNYPAPLDSNGDLDYDDPGDVAPITYYVTDTYGEYFQDAYALTSVTSNGNPASLSAPHASNDPSPTAPSQIQAADPSDKYFFYNDPVVGTFTVQFTDQFVRKNGGKTITIKYTLRLRRDLIKDTSLAGFTVLRGDNKVKVTFSNDPYDTTATKETPEDVEKSYSFPLNIAKKDILTGSPLKNAKFKVYKGDPNSGGTIVRFFETGPSTGKWQVASFSEEVVSRGTEGKLTLEGLDGDTLYTIVESQPPTGYAISNTDKVKFTLYIDTEFGVDGTSKELSAVAYNYGDAGTTVTPGADLPGTAESNLLTLTEPTSLFANTDTDGAGADTAENASIVLKNAKITEDIPFTGGTLLAYLTIAGALGSGAVFFGVIALKRYRNNRS